MIQAETYSRACVTFVNELARIKDLQAEVKEVESSSVGHRQLQFELHRGSM